MANKIIDSGGWPVLVLEDTYHDKEPDFDTRISAALVDLGSLMESANEAFRVGKTWQVRLKRQACPTCLRPY